MAQPDDPASGPSARSSQRGRRYRRRLRSRIILSFVLLGLGLTALFAFMTQEARNRVENALVEDVMNRNIDEAARQYAINPQAPIAPVTQIRAFIYTPDRFESVRTNRPEWYDLPDGIHGISGTDENGEPMAYKLAVRKTPEAWFFLAHDMTQAVKGEEQFRRAVYGAVILFTLLSLLIGWWSASRVMSPVSELAKRLGRSGGSTSPQPLAPHFPDDEVGELAKALDDYAVRLTEVVQRDREFNADVSHELRTPLAVIRGAVELLLSRNERGHGATDVAKVAEQLFDAHRGQLGSKPLQLRVEGEPGQVVVDAPEAAVTVALGNLVGNAVKYTREGEVVVRLRGNAVDVVDSGPGLSAEDAARLFERGYRGTHAEHSQGGGIGLSIVRRLCALYGWNVRVVPGDVQGVVATLTFAPEPAAP